jgi:hypothetical protein
MFTPSFAAFAKKEKKHFLDGITGLTGSFKRLIFDILFIQLILSKGFYVSNVYPSFDLCG